MISDAVIRDEALNPHQSFIVQAPAGSGKTGLLVYRMLTLLATLEKPEQVLAITFTRKATAELQERLIDLLQKADAKISSDDHFEQQGIDLAWTVLQRDRELGWKLLDSPHQLQIQTIDAFCSKLTGSMPWLSRLGDKPKTTDNADQYYAAAVEELFAELLQDDSRLQRALKLVMLELDYDYSRARKLFKSMLAKRDQWLRHIIQNNLQLLRDQLEHAWQVITNEQLSLLAGLFSNQELDKLVEFAKGAAKNIQLKENQDSPLAAFEHFEHSARFLGVQHWKSLRFLLCTGGANGKLRKQVTINNGFAPQSADKGAFLKFLEDLKDKGDLVSALIETDSIPSLQFSDDDWQHLLALEEVLKALAGLLQLQFRSAGEVDHSEVAQRANLALQELDSPTELALRMDYQLQHILVDEFQDTSHSQVELLKRLTAGWSADSNQNTLFLVGDPMQSIYRFREADVSLFLRVVDNARTKVFENIDIQTLVLSENFRSSSDLVAWFNQCFSQSFPTRNDVLSGAIKYSESTSTQSNKSDNHQTDGSVAVDCHWVEDQQHEVTCTLGAIKSALEQLPNDEESTSKVAVLVRTRSQLKELLPLLRKNAIKYQGVDIRPLEQLIAVQDVVALCKAICREDDRLSWLALLRGPWCAMTLSQLQKWTSSNSKTIWQQLCEWHDEKQYRDFPRIDNFIHIMRQAKLQRQQVSLSELVRWAWHELGGDATLFNAELDDIETVFGLIDSLEKGGDLLSISEFDQALQTLYALPTADADARVVISTMHKAKGLQYHTVILPTLSNPPGSNKKEIMMWSEHQSKQGESELLIAPFRLHDSTGHYKYLRELDRKREKNEAMRLMYVACTRAEQKLVLIGKVAVNEETSELKNPPSNTLLSSIWESVEQQFSESYLSSSKVDSPNISANSSIESNNSETLDQTLYRLPNSYKPHNKPSILWKVKTQLNASETKQTDPLSDLTYDWSTNVATAVGVVMHEWLQFNQSRLFEIELDQRLKSQWRTKLISMNVPAAKINYAIERLGQGLLNMQQDKEARVIFQDYPIQDNELTLSTLESGLVKTYRIDRTFVDENNTRWIVDYKTTYTRNRDIDNFIDRQVAERHKLQLQKYGDLFSKLEARNIKLAVYFPMLQQTRSWEYDPMN